MNRQIMPRVDKPLGTFPPVIQSMNVRQCVLLALLVMTTAVGVFAWNCSYAATFSGKLVKVIDGDTVEVVHEGQARRIRLAHIDTPEIGQAHGQAAKRYVLAIAAQRSVQVRWQSTDRYGRTLGEVILPDGTNLNKQIVRAGYAWHYKDYSSDPSYAELEEQARLARRGLWQDDRPTPPWIWRRDRRNATEPSSRTDFKCGAKRYCREMSGCDEAVFYLRNCGAGYLDGDHDGIPCEALCK
ncbi:MAG: thermonuclease family protein [Deltaproteobacteria bacterium]|jgi:endonuclease YncB( thermonuclease family)|nr:thermonuclease family protein [Deltaproteobacteria bacterium]